MEVGSDHCSATKVGWLGVIFGSWLTWVDPLAGAEFWTAHSPRVRL